MSKADSRIVRSNVRSIAVVAILLPHVAVQQNVLVPSEICGKCVPHLGALMRDVHTEVRVQEIEVIIYQ